jgi:hypothetical protein
LTTEVEDERNARQKDHRSPGAQVLKYKDHCKTLPPSAAAAKVGISERSARRLETSVALPSQRPSRRWRTREDPLAAVSEAELLPLLKEAHA